ncbi:MAG: ABC transporter substrate-binding protein [Oscillospiraceae bacterium]|nr:ABC transporter substrate-binding protein [Oscillospiraceae bacterium]
MNPRVKTFLILTIITVLLTAGLILALKNLDSAKTPGKPQPPVLTEHKALPDVEITEKLKLLTWYDIDETSPTALLYKAKYWRKEESESVYYNDDDSRDNTCVPPIPNDEYYKELNSKREIFEVTKTHHENRGHKLAQLIMAGDSPDLFPFDEYLYPMGLYHQLFSPTDDLIDLNSPEWEATKPYIDAFKWKGKNYTAITELDNPTVSLLYYRKSVLHEAGLEDPFDLWEKGKWTWDSFMQMCMCFSAPDKKWGIYGYCTGEAAIASTGAGIIVIEDGLLKSNMYDSRIERAMEFLRELAHNGYHIADFGNSPYDNFLDMFKKGDILFWNAGAFLYEETLVIAAENEKWAEDEICIVPFPRDPLTDDYYQRGNHNALMLVNGAKNTNGFKAWTQCAVVAAQDEEMRQRVRAGKMQKHGWTDEQLDVLERIKAFTQVWDFNKGILPYTTTLEKIYFATPTDDLITPVISCGESYAKMREELGYVIEEQISAFNENE